MDHPVVITLCELRYGLSLDNNACSALLAADAGLLTSAPSLPAHARAQAFATATDRRPLRSRLVRLGRFPGRLLASGGGHREYARQARGGRLFAEIHSSQTRPARASVATTRPDMLLVLVRLHTMRAATAAANAADASAVADDNGECCGRHRCGLVLSSCAPPYADADDWQLGRGRRLGF